MSDTITNTTNTNESKVFNVYVSKSTTAGTALFTRGSLNKTDPTPTVVGLYILEETGVYTNLGNIDAQAGKLNFASFDGTTWSLIAVDMPQPIVNNYTNNNTYNLDPEQIVPSEALYTDDTLAGDVLKRVDKTTGENVNYREFDFNNDLEDGAVYTEIGGKKVKRQFTGSLKASWYGVTGNGITDDSAALKNAIDAAIRTGYDLEIDGTVYLANTVDINRLVDAGQFDEFFTIFSASGASFYADKNNFTMFGSSLPYDGNSPNTQLILFKNIGFKTNNQAFNTYVLDGRKYLRTQFNNCSFSKIRAFDTQGKYCQSIYFFHCNIRRTSGEFVKSDNVTYDFKMHGCLVEQGDTALHLINPNGTSILGNTIEGFNHYAIYYASAKGLTIHGNYFEENGVDIDGRTAGGLSISVSVIGNFFFANSANNEWRVKWGDTHGSMSSGNWANKNLHAVNEFADIFINDFVENGVVTNTDVKYTFIGGARMDNIRLDKNSNDANVLDHYKEGTFTVSDGSDGLTYVSEGQYTRIGNQVFFSLKISVPINTSNNGCYIVGLPVATKSTGVVSSISGNIVSDVGIDGLQLTSERGEGAFRVTTKDGTILTNAQLSNKNLTINGNYFTD